MFFPAVPRTTATERARARPCAVGIPAPASSALACRPASTMPDPTEDNKRGWASSLELARPCFQPELLAAANVRKGAPVTRRGPAVKGCAPRRAAANCLCCPSVLRPSVRSTVSRRSSSACSTWARAERTPRDCDRQDCDRIVAGDSGPEEHAVGRWMHTILCDKTFYLQLQEFLFMYV